MSTVKAKLKSAVCFGHKHATQLKQTEESWQRVAGDEAENFIETKFSRVLDVKELALA